MKYRSVIIMLIMANMVCGKRCDCKWILTHNLRLIITYWLYRYYEAPSRCVSLNLVLRSKRNAL